MSLKYTNIIFIFFLGIIEIYGHGRTMDPVSRGSAWRKGFNTPRDFNDNENYCGGFMIHNIANKGKCGTCGDDYADPQPRAHENGGLYGTGTIVKTYKAGETIVATVDLTASHKGHFEFSICPLKNPHDIETEECFKKYPLKLANGQFKYPITSAGNQQHFIKLVLPRNLKCQHCVFRWHYRTGNTWGICPDGKGAVGCGPQEVFRSCSDIAIV